VNVDVTGWAIQLSGDNDTQSMSFDLNGDTVNDLELSGFRSLTSFTTTITTTNGSTYTNFYGPYAFGNLRIGAPSGAFASSSFQVRKLTSGSGVLSAMNNNLQNPRLVSTSYSSLFTYGGFNPNPSDTGFLGMSFTIGSDTHYAWLEVLVSLDGSGRPSDLQVLSAAYNDVAGQDIAVGAIPEPASVGVGLGLLALGAAGVRRMRGRD
jgi:hypothetical protein